MNDVIDLIDKYLNESYEALRKNDNKAINIMIDKIINTFENEIPNITNRISSNDFIIFINLRSFHIKMVTNLLMLVTIFYFL